jgi:hypothetical protein
MQNWQYTWMGILYSLPGSDAGFNQNFIAILARAVLFTLPIRDVP